MDIQEVLSRAEELCLQLLVLPELPEEVKAILYGKNEAMMTPNVERPDPFLMAHSRHVVDLLEGQGAGTASSFMYSSVLAAFSPQGSSQELNILEDCDFTQTDMNDLDVGIARTTLNDTEPSENRANEEVVSDEEEIVVLSEEAQNIF